jgi:hypothetical protein
MHEPTELRPAPRPTPSIGLWLLATVAVGGSGLLVWAQPTVPDGALVSAARYAPSTPAAHAPPPATTAAPAVLPPALGTLQVP